MTGVVDNPLDRAVICEIREVKAVDLTPAARIKDLGHLRGKGRVVRHGAILGWAAVTLVPMEISVYQTPMRARFRGITVRDGGLLRGPAGWAEVSPFWNYNDAESATWLTAALETAWYGFPQAHRSEVPVNVTVPAVGGERAAAIVAASGGCQTAKVKVAEPGQSLEDEIERLEAVRAAMPDGAIRVDANGMWDEAEAMARLPHLDRAAGGLEYAEQPVATVEGLAAVRRAVDVPIAADESIRRAEDPLRVVELEAADVVVLKVQPLGGIRRCLELAEQVGLPVVVSSALESSVGIAAGVALAAALPELTHACGLATVQLFERDTVNESLLPVDGALPVRAIEPDLSLAPADDETRAKWEARIDRMLSILRERGELERFEGLA